MNFLKYRNLPIASILIYFILLVFKNISSHFLAAEQIVCTTRQAVGSFDVDVQVQTSDARQVAATCTGTCSFNFDSGLTPTVTAVSPSSIDENDENLTFTGKNL